MGDVELTGLNDHGGRNLAFTSRMQKLRPYGFYVLLTTKTEEGAGEELVHAKHVAWKHNVFVAISKFQLRGAHSFECNCCINISYVVKAS